MRIVAAILALVTAAAPAGADSGFIGRTAAQLEIDDCPAPDPAATEAQLTARFGALYERGEVLYAQGDYPGAVRELISGYCIAGGFGPGLGVRYQLLKDIGQAYERSLDYEKAIGYFERFVRDFPDGVEPADKRVVESRVLVLQKLRAQVLVQTSPGGANVTIFNEAGHAGEGRSGTPIGVPGGKYTMRVELPGHEPHSQPIEVRIGKPYAFVVPLRPLQGRLSVLVAPEDAKVFLRDRRVERFVGIGRVDEVLPAGKYVLVADASERLSVERPVEVLPNRVNRLQIDLPLKPRFGRRQLVTFSSLAGTYVTAGLLFAFDNGAIAALGGAGGAALGLFGSYLYLPDQVPLGTSNLTISAGLAGTVAGIAGGLVFTDSPRIWMPAQGLTTLLGAGLGYYVGSRADVTPGDAALFTSSAAWGTTAGALFALAFGGDDRPISAGLVLSGLGVGAAGGVLMARYFDVSRRRTVLIDIGGLMGLLVGVAAKSLAYPLDETGSEASNEHVANFMLGGVALGLIGAGILTRDIDVPKIPVKPAIGAAATASGASTPTLGLAGSW